MLEQKRNGSAPKSAPKPKQNGQRNGRGNGRGNGQGGKAPANQRAGTLYDGAALATRQLWGR